MSENIDNINQNIDVYTSDGKIGTIPGADERIQNILKITPCDTNPILYWHQVAQDATDSADKLRVKLQLMQAERDSIRSDYQTLVDKLIQHKQSDSDTVPDGLKILTGIVAALAQNGVDSHLAVNFYKHDTIGGDTLG